MNASCYSLSGLKAPYDALTYVPCNQTAVLEGGHSACCAETDKCTANGLCQSKTTFAPINEFWRVGCTDKTWKDPACARVCEDVEPDNPWGPSHMIFQCPTAGQMCCATGNPEFFSHIDNTTCCTDTTLAFAAGNSTVWTTAQSSVEATAVVSGASSSSATPTAHTEAPAQSALNSTAGNTSTSANQHTNHTALGVGLGVGIPAALALFAVVALIFWNLGKRREATQHLQAATDAKHAHGPCPCCSEVEAREMAVEMAAHSHDPIELADTSAKGYYSGTGVAPKEKEFV